MSHIEPVEHSKQDIEHKKCRCFPEHIAAEMLCKSSEIYLLADAADKAERYYHKNNLTNGQSAPTYKSKLSSSFAYKQRKQADPPKKQPQEPHRALYPF